MDVASGGTLLPLAACVKMYRNKKNKSLVGAGFARPNTSTDISVDAFGQANPAPTSNLAKCEYSLICTLTYIHLPIL